MPLDHIGFNVGDFAASKAFYLAALSPLDLGIVAEGEGWAMIGKDGRGDFWFGAFGAKRVGAELTARRRTGQGRLRASWCRSTTKVRAIRRAHRASRQRTPQKKH